MMSVAVTSTVCNLPREHDGGGIELVDNGGALDMVAGQELCPVIDFGRHEQIIEVHVEERSLVLQSAMRAGPSLCGSCGSFKPWNNDLGLQTERHDLGILS